MLPTYGYGPKPSWMNGGAQENEMLHEILKCTKSTTDGQRRQRALHGLKNEKGSKYSHPVRGHPTQPSSSPVHRNYAQPLGSSGPLNDSSASLLISGHYRNITHVPGQLGLEIESILLMYYLDTVFPLQFPFYKPSVSMVAGVGF